ncbi:hypothetical protein A4X06_0g5385 [Tilletia controversa]|uniref:Kri1-like C-terminal domain-containing protein n=1 Tax=Tilletia controversa TaxID=13291 RepID=A0A8X7MS43_9BASI|nr:hypothetical protein A4X06_0g5385 [Tilletia controversa]
MDLFGESNNDGALTADGFKVNEEYAARFTHNRRRAELHALQEKYGDGVAGPDDGGDDTDSSDDETEDEDGEQVTADVDAALLRTLARIRNRDQSIYDSSKRIFDSEHERVLATAPGKAPQQASKDKAGKQKRVTLQDYQRQRVQDLIKTSADPARALADATTNPARQAYLDDNANDTPITHVQEQDELRKQVTAAFHDADLQGDQDNEDDFFQPRAPEGSDGEDDADAGGDGAGAYRKYLLAALEGDAAQLQVKTEPTKEKGKKRKRATKEETDEEFLMNYVLNRGWVDTHSASPAVPKAASRSTKAEKPGAAADASQLAYGRDWDAEAAELESEDSFDSRAEAFETAYNFRFESIADGSAPATVQSFARPSQIKESVRREDESRKKKREERKERKEREKGVKMAELDRFRELQREEVRERVKRILKEAGADEEDKFAHLDLDGDFDPNAHDQAMSTAFDQRYYATGEGAPEGAEDYDDDPAEEDADGKPVWDDDIDIDDILGQQEDEEEDAPGAKDKKKKKKDKKKLKNQQKALEKQRAADGSDDDDVDADEDVKMAGVGSFPSSSKLKLEEIDEEALKGLSKEERARKAKEMEDQLDELDYEDMIGDMPTRFKYASVPKINYGLTPVEILMADDKDLNEFMGMKMLQPYRKGGSGSQAQYRRPADLGKRLWEFRSKLAKKAQKMGGAGVGGVVATGSNGEPQKSKRKGKKERLKRKALEGQEEGGKVGREEGQDSGPPQGRFLKHSKLVKMAKAQQGTKFRMTLALPVGAVMNCADNSGAKNLYVIAVQGIGARLNRLPAAAAGDMVVASVKKGKPELRKKVMPAVVIRQRKPWRRRDGVFLYFEDNAGVIVNPKGEMKGSAITGPVAKECADLWPRIASNSSVVV